jgi:hypothetical protein
MAELTIGEARREVHRRVSGTAKTAANLRRKQRDGSITQEEAEFLNIRLNISRYISKYPCLGGVVPSVNGCRECWQAFDRAAKAAGIKTGCCSPMYPGK